MFTLFVASFTQQRSMEMQEAKISLADSIGEQFANELNLAARAGNGYSRKIIYPVRLDGVTPYTIILNNISKSIDIQFSMGAINYSHSFPIVHSNVIVEPPIIVKLPNGSAYGYVLHSSNFTFSRGEMYIQNNNGWILTSTLMYHPSSPSNISVTASPKEIGIGMNTSNITAFVIDQFGNPILDGMLVHFQTNLGTIDEFVPTANGTAMAILTSGSNAGVATVNASVYDVKAYVRVTFTSS
jgi:hypothetical protein